MGTGVDDTMQSVTQFNYSANKANIAIEGFFFDSDRDLTLFACVPSLFRPRSFEKLIVCINPHHDNKIVAVPFQSLLSLH